MGNIYLVPEWFFKFGIGLEILFAFVSALVAVYAYKINKLTCDRKSFLFVIGFSLISASYIIKVLLNLFVLSEIQEGFRALSITNLNTLGLIGTYFHIMIFTLGLVTLAYVTFNTESKRVYLLIVIINVLLILLSYDKARAFNILSSILLVFICIHFGLEYRENRNIGTLIVFLAFILLLFSGIGFIISESYYLNFVIGHFLELGAYLLILLSLILIIRKSR